jgi:hypothetical protein
MSIKFLINFLEKAVFSAIFYSLQYQNLSGFALNKPSFDLGVSAFENLTY